MKDNVAAIIIVRQGSSRLLGKAMMEIMGRPVISLIIERLKHIPEVKQICVATSWLDIDKPILDLAEKEGVISFAGHPEDVLDRLYHAAKECKAKVIYEVGGDCPLVDWDTLIKGLHLMEEGNHDFVHNFAPTTYPDGLDCPLLKYDCLEQMHQAAVLKSHRIHPFSYVFSHPEAFSVANFVSDHDYSHIRLTLDYQEDFQLIKEVFERLYPSNPQFSLQEVLQLFQEQPELPKINAHYVQPPSPQGYWNTLAYIDDLHDDLAALVKSSKDYNREKDYAQAEKYYAEIIHIVSQLKQRVRHLQQNV